MSNWVYVESAHEPRLWTTGFYDPNGKWHPDNDYSDREEAAKRCSWLNGQARWDELNESRIRERERAKHADAVDAGNSDHYFR